MILRSVVLPQPDGPKSALATPVAPLDVDAFDGVVARHVGVRHVYKLDRRHQRTAAALCTSRPSAPKRWMRLGSK